MKKTVTKSIALAVILFMCLGFLNACSDYGYEYYFSVVGENGTISTGWWDNTASVWHDEPSPLILRGGKNGNHQLKFIATPNNGYQVKEWKYNGKLVEGNKTNTLITGNVNYKQSIITITVEFEPIPS